MRSTDSEAQGDRSGGLSRLSLRRQRVKVLGIERAPRQRRVRLVCPAASDKNSGRAAQHAPLRLPVCSEGCVLVNCRSRSDDHDFFPDLPTWTHRRPYHFGASIRAHGFRGADGVNAVCGTLWVRRVRWNASTKRLRRATRARPGSVVFIGPGYRRRTQRPSICGHYSLSSSGGWTTKCETSVSIWTMVSARLQRVL